MISKTELAGFLALRAGFRHELGRLADAAAAPRDQAHEELLEAHLALVLDLLQAHHAHEAEQVWPFLLDRCPQAAAALAGLERERALLEPLIEAAGDPRRPLTERAGTLRRLHVLLDDHLDHEERVTVPLVLVHYTAEMLDRDRRRALTDIGRRRMAVVFGWIASCLDDDQLTVALAEHPRLVQYLFRRFWWPDHQQRMTELYGAAVRPVSATLAEGVAA